ncbi:MAG: hypothetical protein RBS80_23360 [Thermoguttaceae bacterium]|nr:hypothetical protein [Thermoguttaceae bacterium]
MNRATLWIGAISLLALAAEAQSQVTARSYSDGGVATAHASGVGRTNLHAEAAASRGAQAHARISGNGLHGGYATGTSIAVSDRGRAVSNAHSDARGWGARSHVESVAGSVRGVAISQSNAFARGNSQAISHSTATAHRGTAISRADADASGRRGGSALAESESVADAYRGSAVSRSRVQAWADYGGRAVGQGHAMGLGWGRHANASVHVESGARFGGRSHASGSHLDW